MTWDIIWGIARAILAGLGGLLVRSEEHTF